MTNPIGRTPPPGLAPVSSQPVERSVPSTEVEAAADSFTAKSSPPADAARSVVSDRWLASAPIGDVAKAIIECDESERQALLERVPVERRAELLASLRDHVRAAGDEWSRTRSADSVLALTQLMAPTESTELGDLTKSLLHLPDDELLRILERTFPEERRMLMESLREHYAAALDDWSRSHCSRAILVLSQFMITEMPGFDPADPSAVSQAVLRFMNQWILPVWEVDGAEGRDAANWSGERVLAAGNFNGCVEAAKLFMTLMHEVSTCELQYVSSFSLAGAEAIVAELQKPESERNQDLIDNPPGHAVIRLIDPATGELMLIDPSMFGHPLLGATVREEDLDFVNDIGVVGKILQVPGDADLLVQRGPEGFAVNVYPYGQIGGDLIESHTFATLEEVNAFIADRYGSATAADLQNAGVIKTEEDRTFAFDSGQWGGTYVIFDESEESPFTQQYGPGGSSTVTLEAILRYFGLASQGQPPAGAPP